MAEKAHLDSSSGGISLLRLLGSLILRWRWVVGALFGGAIIGCLAALLVPRYEAKGSFTVQGASSSSLASLAAVAGQFGVSLPGGVTDPTQLFQYMVTSEDVLRTVLRDTVVQTDGTRQLLLDYLDVDGDTLPEKVRNAVKLLREHRVNVDLKSDPDVVVVGVRMDDPNVAEFVTSRLLQIVDSVGRERRSAAAREEREFSERRVAEAAGQLHDAENAEQAFLLENRTYASSPQLAFEYDRLQRNVSFRQQIYLTLAQGAEQARIDEVRNTPLVTLVEDPKGTADKARSFGLAGVVGAILALGLLLVGLTVYEIMAREAKADANYAGELQVRVERLKRFVPRKRAKEKV